MKFKRNLKTAKQNTNLIEGLIKRNPDGFGFLIPNDAEHPDVYIPKNSMTGIMTNDRVLIRVSPEKGGERFRGEIEKIISRGTQKVVGKFQLVNEHAGIIKDEGKGWGLDLHVELKDAMGAVNGELVAAEILHYPEGGKNFKGKIIERLGDSLDPLSDIRRVLHSFNIPEKFSDASLAQAKKYHAEVLPQDWANRKNLQNLNFVTIDGATAKDFDDAIFVESGSNGFTLYVAIADVSHYVKENSPIDQDAYIRGTSVYFPNFVVPMLPEMLSNELCSLKPKVPRLALVSKMTLDHSGTLMNYEFFEAVIESKARVTYGEAQEIIEETVAEKFKAVATDIQKAGQLAHILMAKRFREGSLDLDIPETQLIIDGSGNPIDILVSERLFAHKVIEEMMLIANVAAARFINDKSIPGLFRIHDRPNPDAMEILEGYLQKFGGQTDLNAGLLQKRLTKALDEFTGRPEALILNILTLRSMAQAKYSPNNIGHFGLGFSDYAHFTSPIRRYPDLIVHRLIKSQILKSSEYHAISEDDLTTAGNMLSACEQRSVKAERQLMSIKKARYVQKYVGQEFDGIISSIARFGVFVLVRQLEIDGLVKIEKLSKGKIFFDEENLQLVSPKTGLSFSIGDHIRIRVDATNIEEGLIDFSLVGNVSETAVSAGHRSAKKQKPTPKDQQKFEHGHQRKPHHHPKPQHQSKTHSHSKPHAKLPKKVERAPEVEFKKPTTEGSTKDFWIQRLDAAISSRPKGNERSHTAKKRTDEDHPESENPQKKSGKPFFKKFVKNDKKAGHKGKSHRQNKKRQ